MRLAHAVSIATLSCILAACSTTSTTAPIIDRPPSSKPATSKNTATKASTKISGIKNSTDWRPDNYTVKKGDTLFSIGLEHGYYYKDIAQANDIKSPYTIKVGQVLKLISLKEKPATSEPKQAQEPSGDVTTYPMSNDAEAPAPNTGLAEVVSLSEPKGIREPYSEEAFKKTTLASKAADEKLVSTEKLPSASTVTDPKIEPKAESKSTTKSSSESTDNLEWSWPTKGKVIGHFNDAGNKGIDIAGSMGQSVMAASTGKVIYAGSDLRSYGKLVIVKHNANYLSVYAHNSQILVKEGQQVSAGQKIAEMGNTDSSIVKLHFEIRQQGKSVDPVKFLASNE